MEPFSIYASFYGVKIKRNNYIAKAQDNSILQRLDHFTTNTIKDVLNYNVTFRILLYLREYFIVSLVIFRIVYKTCDTFKLKMVLLKTWLRLEPVSYQFVLRESKSEKNGLTAPPATKKERI